MALIGLVRVGKDPDEVRAQRELLEPICPRIFEERASRRRLVRNRPELLAALAAIGDDDMLVVTRARCLAQRMDHGFEVLLDLVDHGVAVKVLSSVAAGEHTADS